MQHYARFLMGRKASAISFAGSAAITHAGGLTGYDFTLANGFQNEEGANVSPVVGDTIICMAAHAGTASRSDAQLTPFGDATSLMTPFTGISQTGSDTIITSGKLFFKRFTGVDTKITCPGGGGSNMSSAHCFLLLRGVDKVTTPPQESNTVGTSGANGARPNPVAPLGPTAPGIWIIVGCAGGGTGPAVYTNPGDLAALTNNFRSIVATGGTARAVCGLGFKRDWASGSFDPAQWGGGDANTASSWLAYSLVLLPG